MLVWLTLPFYDFCGFRSVAVNSVYKLQFLHLSVEDRATATGNMYRKFCEVGTCGFEIAYASRQTYIQTR